MNSKSNFFDTIDMRMWQVFRFVAVGCAVVLFVLLLGNVTVRVFKLGSFGWFDEIVEMSFAYLVFFGSAALCKDSEHFRIDWLEEKLEGTKVVRYVTVIVELITLVFFVLFFLSGLKLTLRAKDVTAILNIRKSLLYASLPFAGFGMVYYSIRGTIRAIIAVFRESDHDGSDITSSSLES